MKLILKFWNDFNTNIISKCTGTHDSWADIDNKFYERVVSYQRKGVNVSLALGGWNDSQGLCVYL